MYILALKYGKINYPYIEFYKGGTFRHQGEKYACISTDKRDAKLFKSRKVAENAYLRLRESCVNIEDMYEIIEVEDCMERDDSK